MSPEEGRTLRFLRREYGISAQQWWDDVPDWELDVLLSPDDDEDT